MKVTQLDKMTKGWFIGDFDPVLLKTKDFEVAIKYYNKGDHEGRHVHKVAIEITAVVYGRVQMNDRELNAGDIIQLEPGEPTDFFALEDCCTVVVKTPSVMGDKYVL